MGSSVTASASSSVYDSYNIPESTPIINSNGISSITGLTSGGEPAGVYISGSYFSDIALTIYLYDVASFRTDSSYSDDDTLMDAIADINSVMNYIDTLANTQYEQSDVYMFNMAEQGDTVYISDMTAEMIMCAQSMYDITDGAYNPAVYRLVDLWGFSSRVWSNGGSGMYAYDRDSYKDLPATKYIDAFMDLCDFSQVELGGSAGSYTLTKNCQDVVVDGVSYSQWIDLGGIAKGYAVELVADILESYGYMYYYIDNGGSSSVFTTKEDGSVFSQSIEEPYQYAGLFGNIYATLSVSNSALSTSGLYNRCYTVDGVTYSHIIDGSTGYPVEYDMPTVTVVGATAWAADCLTTSFTIMGADGIVEFVNDGGLTAVLSLGVTGDNTSLSFVGSYIYDGDNQGIITNFSTSAFSYINEEYPIVSQMTENGIFILLPTSNDFTWIIVLASVLAAIAIGVLLYVRFHYGRTAMFAVDNVRKGRLFIKSDIVVYVLLFVLIISLFWVFVFTADSQEYEQLQIIDTSNDQVVFVYDRASGEYYANESYRLDIVVEQCDDGCICVYIYNEGETDMDNYINLLCIEPDGTAKMTDSVCGVNQECVNNFPAITDVGDITVCSPNNIKVVGVGGDS